MRKYFSVLILFAATSPAFGAEECHTVAECAQLAMSSARAAQEAAITATPSGAVMAFNRADCPAGWSIFKAAQGRFIRGVDQSGIIDKGGSRVVGSLQHDTFQGHRHNMEASGGTGLWDSTQGTGPSRRAAITNYGNRKSFLILEPITDPNRGPARVDAETRPKNVALLYCERN